MRARTAAKILIAVGLFVISTGILVPPPEGVMPFPYIIAPSFFSQAYIVIDLGMFILGFSLLAVGVVWFLRAKRSEAEWVENP